jgi:hypothetical protein
MYLLAQRSIVELSERPGTRFIIFPIEDPDRILGSLLVTRRRGNHYDVCNRFVLSRLESQQPIVR